MENIELNKLLNREEKADLIKDLLSTFESNKNDLLVKKGVYIYGDPGTGKTKFITQILNEMNLSIIFEQLPVKVFDIRDVYNI